MKTYQDYIQEIEERKIPVDSLFREDQFFVSVSYNLVQNRPSGFKQFGFSQGFTAGFLRDFPISKDRKWAIAPGVGYSYNNIKQFVNSDEIFGDYGNGTFKNTVTGQDNAFFNGLLPDPVDIQASAIVADFNQQLCLL